MGALKRLRPLVGLLLLLAGAVLFLLQMHAYRASGGDPAITYGVPAGLHPDFGRGVGANVDLFGLSDGERGAWLRVMQDNGLTWARQRFSWADMEPRPGDFRWSEADAVVAALERADIRLVAVLETSPEWSRGAGQTAQRYAPPDDYAAFGDFAAAFARRYRASIEHYQVWDEPNIYPHWGDRYVDPEAYVALLREAATRIRAEDDDAVILLAGLAPNVETGPININEVDYLRRVLDAGAGPFFDVATVKSYGFEEGPDDRRLNLGLLNFNRAALVRQVLVQSGRESTPVWAVEFGWNALPPDWSGRAAPWGTEAAVVQAERSLAAVARARAEWPWMGPMLWSRLSAPDEAGDPAYGFALVERDTTPTALGRLLLPGLGQMTAPPLGRQAPDSEWAAYSPGWRVTGDAADPSAAGDSATIRFQGTALDLILSTGPYWATWDVAVDGQASQALPRHEGRSYLVLYDPLGAMKRITVAAGLAPGVHELRLTVDGGWGQWPLLGWVSWREAPNRVEPVAWAGAVLLLLVGLYLVRADGVARAAVDWLVMLGEQLPAAVPALVTVGLGAAFWLSGGLVVSALAGIGLAVLAVLAPQWLLGLALGSLPFFLVPKVVLGMSLAMPEVLSWLLLAGAIVRVWAVSRRARLRPRFQALDVLVGLLALAALLSSASASNTGVAWHEFRRVVVSATALYLGTRLTGRRALWPAIVGVLLGAAGASAIGIGQYLQGENLITAGAVARVRAWYGSPNNLALYLGRAIPLALGLLIFCRRPPARAAAALAFAVCLAGGVLTRSRGLILIGLPLSTVWLVWHTKWRRGHAAWLGLAVAVVLLAVLLAGGRVGPLLSGQDAAAGMRLHVWTSALHMIRDHPLLGVGPDNFLYLYRTQYILPQAWAEPNLSHPHNLILDFWLSAGALGLVALVGLVAATARQVRRAIGMSGAVPAAYLGVGAALLAALGQGLVDNSFFLVDLSHITLAYLALIANASGEALGPSPTRANSSLERTL